jgi:hypothetical protein
MAFYTWDLGFDLTEIEDNHFLSVLQNGSQLNGAPTTPLGATPSSSAGFNINDTIAFNIFNLTPGAVINDNTTILRTKLFFKMARVDPTGTTGLIPFASQPPLQTGLPDTTGPSTIFGNSNFPRWTGPPQTITTNGHFLFTAAVMVQGPGTNNIRNFVVDPEMIVGGAGSP